MSSMTNINETDGENVATDNPRNLMRPPPLSLPPLPPKKPTEDITVIVSHSNQQAGGEGQEKPLRRTNSSVRGNASFRANGSFRGRVVENVVSEQVLTAIIQDSEDSTLKGSFFQHQLASLEMKMFATSLQMHSDADTRMGKRELRAVQQIAERLSADASRSDDHDDQGERRPPLTITSLSDCFRLFFGSNVTIFPFYAARLGGVGLIVISVVSCFINTFTTSCLHRARHNLVAIELHRRIDEHILDANGVTPKASAMSGEVSLLTPRQKGDVADLNLFMQKAAERLNEIEGNLDLKEEDGTTTVQVSNAEEEKTQQVGCVATIEEYADMQVPDSGGDIVPYFLGLNSMVKIGNALWPDHWLRQAVMVTSCISQFFSCCNFSLLMSKNIAPIIGVDPMPAVVLCAVLTAMLTMAMNSTTSTYMAHCSNIFIFGGGAFLLLASLGHEQTEEEKDTPMQVFPKSVKDFLIYSPSVLMFLAAPIVSLEVETIVAARIYPIIKNTFELSRNIISLPTSPAISPRNSPRSSPQITSPSTPTGTPVSPTSRNARAYNMSLIYVNIIQKYYGFVMRLGLLLCVAILLIISELILWSFKDNTNSVIALSLPESAIRTAILVSLTIGLYACGTLALGPICTLMDGMAAKVDGMVLQTLQRVLGRAVFFVTVILFLWLIPFFDLVTALSSTVRGATLIFFIPLACELQSEILRASTKSENRQFAASATFYQRFRMGFGSLPLRSQVMFVVGMFLGTFILVVSTSLVLMETIRRQREG